MVRNVSHELKDSNEISLKLKHFLDANTLKNPGKVVDCKET